MGEMAMEMEEKKDIPFQKIISGAGQDSQVCGPICPITLLLVASQNRISYSLKEFTSLEDLEVGIELLTDLLIKLAY